MVGRKMCLSRQIVAAGWLVDLPPLTFMTFCTGLDDGGKPRLQQVNGGGHALQHYPINSSARASTVGGIVRPSSLAVFKLIMSSNLVGCSIGISAGFPPLKIILT